jgi:hypothetical protein
MCAAQPNPQSLHHTADSRRATPCRFAFGRAVLILITYSPALTTIPQTACAATLQELFNGASLDVGYSRFSHWQLISSDSTAAVPNLAQITVDPLAADPLNPGLQFTANGQLSTSGINSIDLVFRFRVDRLASGNTFTGHTLELTGITFGGNGGIAFVSDEIVGSSGDLGSAVAIADQETDFIQLQSAATFAPKYQLFVATNIFLNGLSSGDAINLATFTQRFAQNGPPGVSGDYNQNGSVDAADYIIWRKNVGTTNALPNDNLGGTIGTAHYNQWRNQFGQVVGSGSVALASTSIPEPASLLMLVAGMAAVGWGKRSRRIMV